VRSKPNQRKSKARKAKPLTSREKVRAHRVRLRAQGLRPVTLWVPDMRAPKFATEARRQCMLANNSRYAAADQAWVDSMSDWRAN
jgi:hypothetical protein